MEHFPVRPWLNFFMVLVFLWVQFPLSQGTATPNGTSLFTKCRAMLAFRDPILVQKICGTSLEGKSTDASQTTTSHGGMESENGFRSKEICGKPCLHDDLINPICLDNGTIFKTVCQAKAWKCNPTPTEILLPNMTCRALSKLEGGITINFPNVNETFLFQLKRCLVWSLDEVRDAHESRPIEPMPFKDLHKIANKHESSQNKHWRSMDKYFSRLEALKQKYVNDHPLSSYDPSDPSEDKQIWDEDFRLGQVHNQRERLKKRSIVSRRNSRDSDQIKPNAQIGPSIPGFEGRSIGPCWVFPFAPNGIQTFLVEECVVNSKDVERCRKLIEINSYVMAKRLQHDIQALKAQPKPSQKPLLSTKGQEIFQDLKRPMDHPSFITSLEDNEDDLANFQRRKSTITSTTPSVPTQAITSSSSVSTFPKEIRSVNNHTCQPFWKLNGLTHSYCSIPIEMGFCLCATEVDKQAEISNWDKCPPVSCANKT